MRKFVLYAATAVIAMSITVPVPAQAAMKGFVISGNTMGTLSGFDCGNLEDQLKDLLIANGNCFPGQSRPDVNRPEQNRPEQSRPEQNRPEQGRPEQNRPEQGRPEQSRPEQSRPEQSRPEQNQPGQNQPEQNQPEQNQPEQNQPEQNQPEQDQPSQAPDQEESTNDSYVQQVINLVNEERAKAGLSPLTEAQDVAQAAAVRAEEIFTSFSHTRPDGSSFSTALAQSGVSFRGAGENIAYGQRSPEDVMESWMNSQGHRANILNEDYTTIGVGYYEDASGTGYWVQLFTY